MWTSPIAHSSISLVVLQQQSWAWPMAWELKGNNSLWVYFLQEIQSLVQGLRAPIGVHHFHQLPAIKSSCQIVIPPDFCPPLKMSVWKKEQEPREAHTKAWQEPGVDQCPAAVIRTDPVQRLGFSTFLVSRRCALVWMLRGKELQNPDRQIQDFCCQTWCKWPTFCLCCVGKENEILDTKALCHWSSVKWVGLWAHPNKKSGSAFWLEQILALSLIFWGF